MGEKVRDMGAKDRTYRTPRSAPTPLSHEQLAAQAEAMESQELSSTVQFTNEHIAEMRTDRYCPLQSPRDDGRLPSDRSDSGGTVGKVRTYLHVITPRLSLIRSPNKLSHVRRSISLYFDSRS